MFDLAEVRQTFCADGPAGVRRNLAAGIYSPKVAEAAARWLDDTEDESATRLQSSLADMQSVVRRAAATSVGAAIFSAMTLFLVLHLVLRRH